MGKNKKKKNGNNKGAAASKASASQPTEKEEVAAGGFGSSAAASSTPGGCHCPHGCVKNEPILPRARQRPGTVQFACENEQCPLVPFLHVECCDKWEEQLVKDVFKVRNYRTATWTKQHVEQQLWSKKVYELTRPLCKCPCGSFIRRQILDEKATRRAQQNAPLPQPAVNVPGMEHPDTRYSSYRLHGRTCTARHMPPVQPTSSKAPKPLPGTKYVPVGAPGWKERFGESSSPPPSNSAANRKSSEPSLHSVAQVWLHNPVTSGAPPSHVSSNESVVDFNDLPPEPNEPPCQSGLGPKMFLFKLEQCMRKKPAIKLWDGDMEVESLREAMSCELMMAIVEIGGMEPWLIEHTPRIRLQNNTFVLANDASVRRTIKCIATVSAVDECGRSGLLHCRQYDCRVAFDKNSCVSTNSTQACSAHAFIMMQGDIVQVEAQKCVSRGAECSYYAVKMEVLQRATDDDGLDEAPEQSPSEMLISDRQLAEELYLQEQEHDQNVRDTRSQMAQARSLGNQSQTRSATDYMDTLLSPSSATPATVSVPVFVPSPQALPQYTTVVQPLPPSQRPAIPMQHTHHLAPINTCPPQQQVLSAPVPSVQPRIAQSAVPLPRPQYNRPQVTVPIVQQFLNTSVPVQLEPVHVASVQQPVNAQLVAQYNRVPASVPVQQQPGQVPLVPYAESCVSSNESVALPPMPVRRVDLSPEDNYVNVNLARQTQAMGMGIGSARTTPSAGTMSPRAGSQAMVSQRMSLINQAQQQGRYNARMTPTQTVSHVMPSPASPRYASAAGPVHVSANQVAASANVLGASQHQSQYATAHAHGTRVVAVVNPGGFSPQSYLSGSPSIIHSGNTPQQTPANQQWVNEPNVVNSQQQYRMPKPRPASPDDNFGGKLEYSPSASHALTTPSGASERSSATASCVGPTAQKAVSPNMPPMNAQMLGLGRGRKARIGLPYKRTGES